MKTVSLNVIENNKELNVKNIFKSVADLKTQAAATESSKVTTESDAKAGSTGAVAKQGGMMEGLISFMPFIIMGLAFYFLIIRPGNKKQKELKEKIAKVKKDDKVLTVGGIIAIVDKVDETEVVLKVDDKTKITFSKAAIVEIYTGMTPAK